jgi:peptidoglycan/LPS O-acetylase OafA/YrhL
VPGNRIVPLDHLRAAAILGVVAIHATSPLLASLPDGSSAQPSRFWMLAALNQAGRFSVPAFFLLAGFLAAFQAEKLRGGSGARDYLKRRLARLLVPYLTWSVALFALPVLAHRKTDAADLAFRFLLGWTFTGAYFLLALAQLTLLAPALIRIVRKSRLAALTLWSLFFFMTEIFYGVAAYGRSGTSLHVREAFSASLSLFFVWGSYFVAGLWAARERERLLPWLGERRLFWAGLGAALYAASLWEFGAVHESTRSLGLAASFLKPTSALFALAACSFFLGTTGARAAEPVAIVRKSPPARTWKALAAGSFAIYLLHGSVVLSLLGIAAPSWQAVAAGPAGPLLLGAAGIAGPLAFYRLTERFAPRWARFAMFG